jgi:hypothetical protein
MEPHVVKRAGEEVASGRPTADVWSHSLDEFSISPKIDAYR